ADLEGGVRGAAALDGGLDQFADALLVESDERVQLVKSLALVGGEECRGVVAGNAVGGLRQIVSAERVEIDMARNVGGAQCRARQLDHGAKGEALPHYRRQRGRFN